MIRTLIKNGYIITMDGPPIKEGNIVIEGNKIAYLGKGAQPADHVIDARGCIVMPGLVNAHTHIGMTLFRGYADDLPLKQWSEDYIRPAEAELTDNDVYISALLGCLEMICSGTTAFADMDIHMDSVAEAVEESGIRAALSYDMSDLNDKVKEYSELAECGRFVRKWNGAAGGRITAMYGLHAPHTCSKEFLAKLKMQVATDKTRMHIQVLETKAELIQAKEQYGLCSIHMLNELGLLGPDVLMAHCVWISSGDIDILAQKSVNVAHCPVSNMKMASGVAPVPELLKRGANVALGTDSCSSNNSLDMFGEMKTASLLHKVHSMDSTILSANEVVKMATTNGAKALGIPAGILKVGTTADIILVDMHKPHLTPVYDPISHLVYVAKGSDVRTTIVDGQVLMEDYVVKSMDQEKVMEKSINVAERLVRRIKED
jgi:5-methylthioadenosine/S-adenosylhomocysteine deaminase